MSDTALMVKEVGELSVDDVHNQVGKIQTLMKELMKKDEHYGVIPGTNKPTLLKAGAEKLGFTFRLVPEFELRRNDLPDGHREYEVICTLRHMTSGNLVGQGVGNCSTMESKYRYRNDWVDTGRNVPPQYWKTKDPSLLGGKQYHARKIDGVWKIAEKIKGENPDIADVYNTVLKMAKKRAHVDAMITACAASDIFTQDVEDLPTEQPPPPSQNGNNGEKKKDLPQKNKDFGNKLNSIINDAVHTLGMREDEGKSFKTKLKEAVSNMKKLQTLEKKLNTRIENIKKNQAEDVEFEETPEADLNEIAEEAWKDSDPADKQDDSKEEAVSIGKSDGPGLDIF
jgi:hypothetical protein